MENVKLKLLLVFIIILFPSEMSARMIRGVVTNTDTGEPVPYATVALKEVGTGAITDEEGKFSINQVKPGRWCYAFIPKHLLSYHSLTLIYLLSNQFI